MCTFGDRRRGHTKAPNLPPGLLPLLFGDFAWNIRETLLVRLSPLGQNTFRSPRAYRGGAFPDVYSEHRGKSKVFAGVSPFTFLR